MAIQSYTITRTIVGINPIGNGIWQIQFNPAQTVVTTKEVTYPVIYGSSSALPVVLNPYLNNVGNWGISDYNAIINNTDINQFSQFWQSVDYSTNQLIPINFEQIISGTAYPAEVVDSNYTSNWYIVPRYLGAKNSTDNFNTSSISTVNSIATSQNINLGPTTLGQASVNNFDTTIYEFAWGGGTYPEIPTGGALKLSQILNVDNTGSADVISSINPAFGFTINTNLPSNTQPQFTQYTTIANIPNTARVMTTEFGVPTISTYILPSNGSYTATINASRTFIGLNNSVYNVSTNSSGYYTTGSATLNTVAATTISDGLANGERWFISLYDELPIPVQGNLVPVNSGSSENYSTITTNGYSYPITYNGVYEITSVNTANSYLYLDPYLPRVGSIGGSASNLGMLIWKSITDGTFILFNGATLSGVGKGNIINQEASPTIKNNLQYITATFGTNN